MIIRSTPLLMLTITQAIFAQAIPSLWTEYQSNPDNHPNVPNNSYAGYRYGDVALPSPASPQFNVLDYGAVGNGVIDDTTAIRNAIEAAGVAGGGVVYLPAGTFLCSGVLFIHDDNVILRGAGKGQTTLRFNRSLQSGYAMNFSGSQSVWSWAGGLVWFTPRDKNTYLPNTDNIHSAWVGGHGKMYMADGEKWRIGEVVTAVTSTPDRGASSFQVANASSLAAGQVIALRFANPPDFSLLKYLGGDGDWANATDWNSGTEWINSGNRPHFDWVVEIQSVAGNTVTLMQPLRLPLRTQWNVQVMEVMDTVNDSGIEHLSIELMRDYNWNVGSHHNKEPGWNGVYFNNAVHCFAREVNIYDGDMFAGTAASKNITFSGVHLLRKNRTIAHHGFTTRVQSQDILFENFLVTIDLSHGLNVEDFSLGNVWSNGVMMGGCLDTHKLMPADAIRTGIKIINTGGFGGAGEAGPQMGARIVHWGVEVKNGVGNTITETAKMPMGAVVGIRGLSVANPLGSGCIIEATGEQIEPFNLYVAQKNLRNAYLGELMPLGNPSGPVAIPATLQAEHYHFGLGISDKGSFVGSYDYGDWIEFEITVPVSGEYPLTMRYASESATPRMVVRREDETLLNVALNSTGSWSNWHTVNLGTVFLNAGEHTLRFTSPSTALDCDWFAFGPALATSGIPFADSQPYAGKYYGYVVVDLYAPQVGDVIYYTTNGSEPGASSAIYTEPLFLNQATTLRTRVLRGSEWGLTKTALYDVSPPMQIPGKLEAEHLSEADGVIIEGVAQASNGAQVRDINTGSWMAYAIDAPSRAYYNVELRVSARWQSSSTELYVGEELAASFFIPRTNSWTSYVSLNAEVLLEEGVHVLVVESTGDGWNMDFLNFTQSNAPPPPLEDTEFPTVAITAPVNGSVFTEPAAITITAQAEDSDGFITKVEFYNGTTKLGETTTAPYLFNWSDVPAGLYQITARAIDNVAAVTISEPISITVRAPGSFLEAEGLIVIEAENFSGSDKRSDSSEWSQSTSIAGFSGSGYVQAPSIGGNGAWATAAELSYPIRVLTSGSYTLWVRRYAADAGDNSFYAGVNGTALANTDNFNGDFGQWVWRSLGSVSLSDGYHLLQIRRREANYRVDKLLLTRTGMVPSGLGPVQSEIESDEVADPFAEWLASFGPEVPVSMRGPLDDPDRDGILNIAEYALGGHPLVADVGLGLAPVASLTPDTLAFSFTRRSGIEEDLISIEYSSGDLSSWMTVPSQWIQVEAEGTVEHVILTVPATTQPVFMRLGFQY